MKAVLRRIGKGFAALACLVFIVDGALSMVVGARWLEFQREKMPTWYGSLCTAVLKLPDPSLRALGGVQALLFVLLLALLKGK